MTKMATSGTKRKRIDSSELDQMLPFKEIANTLNVSHSQVFYAKDQIQIQFKVEQIENQESKRRRIAGSGRAPDLQVALLEWYHEAKLNNIPITGPILIYKAKQLATRLNMYGFTPSYGWLDKWGVRNDIWKKTTKPSSLKQTSKNDTIIKDRSSIESHGIKGKSSISTSTESNVIKDKSSILTSTESNGIKDKSSILTSTESYGDKDKSSILTPNQTKEIKNGLSIHLSDESNDIKDRSSTKSIGIEDRSAIPKPSKRSDIKDKSSALTPSKSNSTKDRSSKLTHPKSNIIKRKSSILKRIPKHGIRDIRSFLTPTKPSRTNKTPIVDTQLNLTFTKQINLHPTENNGTDKTRTILLSPTEINSPTTTTPVKLHVCSIKQELVDPTVCNTTVAKETPPLTNFRPIKLESHHILTRNERISSTSTSVNLNPGSIKQEPIDSSVCNTDHARVTLPTMNFRPIKLEPVEIKLTAPSQVLANSNKIRIKPEPMDSAFATTEETRRDSTSMTHVSAEVSGVNYPEKLVSTSIKHVSTSAKHISTPIKQTHTSDIPSTLTNEFQKQTVPITDAEAMEAVTLLRKYCGQCNIGSISETEKRDDVIYDKIKRQSSIVDFVVKLGVC